MSSGLIVPRGHGRPISTGGMDITYKVTSEHAKSASSFEVLVAPGFDVGAHVHKEGEELFYILEGELDLLSFEPSIRTQGNWQAWQSPTGERVYRGSPGCMMFVPPGCPHAFANPSTTPARMFFQASSFSQERYFEELMEIVTRGGPPDIAAIEALRGRYGIEQLTPLIPGHRHERK